MASKLVNLIALSTLAVLAISFGPASTNALATGHHNVNRHVDHSTLAKKKRSSGTRCKVRSTSLVASSTTHKTTASPTANAIEPTTTKTTSSKSTKTSTASSSSSTSSSSSGTGAAGTSTFGKKGSKLCAAWGEGDDTTALKNFKTDHMVGLYNWGPSAPSDAAEFGWDFWPMLWGGDSSRIAAFQKATSGSQLGSIVLGFNEPNEEGQSNMDPTAAAKLWQQYIQPLKAKGYKLATPAMSSRPNGIQWMKTFMGACDGCTFDYLATHWYDIGFDTLKTYLTQWHDDFGLPVMLTEFADQNFNGGSQADSDEIWSFMTSALEFFDNTDWMVAACAFGVMTDLQGVNTLNLLETGSHTPTALGNLFINNAY